GITQQIPVQHHVPMNFNPAAAGLTNAIPMQMHHHMPMNFNSANLPGSVNPVTTAIQQGLSTMHHHHLPMNFSPGAMATQGQFAGSRPWQTPGLSGNWAGRPQVTLDLSSTSTTLAGGRLSRGGNVDILVGGQQLQVTAGTQLTQ